MLANGPGAIQLVRDLMGSFAASLPDSALVNDTLLALTWDAIVARYPAAETEVDPDQVARIDRAQAYLLASRAISTTSDKVQTRVGDMTMTENVPVADLYARWDLDAWAILRALYPQARTSSLFMIAPGLRGGGNRRVAPGSDRPW